MSRPQLPSPDDKPAYLKGSVTPLFSDVFISYSRKDKVFVRRLFQALEAANRKVWVDWEDIPPTADWQQEIYTGIETASNFVFVLSPASITSISCLKELEYATQNKKRIIPLVYREIDSQNIKEELHKLNWIFFTQSETFDIAFQQLLFALDTDITYWDESARLLARTKEWERKGKDRSSTLRGKELKEAERWVQAGATKIPPPGPLVLDFISVSSRQRKQFRIITVAIVLVFLLISGSSLGFFLNSTLVLTLADSGPGSLRQAISNAPPGSVITFAPWLRGIIQLNADLHITKNLTIRGSDARVLAVGSIPKYHYTVLVDTGKSVTISGLTFTSGIDNAGTLTLTNSIVSNNMLLQGDGGGISNTGTLSLTSSIVSSNTAQQGVGGGIYNSGRLMLTNSTVSNNTADLGGGGGIYNSGTLILTNSTVSNNTSGSNGGGLYNDIDAMMTITNSTISGNTMERYYFGGGIDNGGVLTITNSTISGNSAKLGNGGGITNDLGKLTLINSTVSYNTVEQGDGGGILNLVPAGFPGVTTSIITFCTIYGNSASRGSGIDSANYSITTLTPSYQNVQMEIRNSIVAANFSRSGPTITGTLTTYGYNLFQDVTGSVFFDPANWHGTDLVFERSTNLSRFIDPILRTNGGQTLTQKLLSLPGNPAIDVIPLNACHIENPVTHQLIITDQRGQIRPDQRETACDIGAYESSS